MRIFGSLNAELAPPTTHDCWLDSSHRNTLYQTSILCFEVLCGDSIISIFGAKKCRLWQRDGNEFAAVVLPMSKNHWKMLANDSIQQYTAIIRLEMLLLHQK